MKSGSRQSPKAFLTEFMMSFFVCTACICILEGVLGMIFFPRQRFGYDAFFSPPLFGFVSVLFGIVTYSKRELTMREVIVRRCIHLLLIEVFVVGLNYAAGTMFSTVLVIVLVLAIAVIFVAVYAVLYVNDKRDAVLFNEELKKYQKRVKQEGQETDDR